MTLLLYKTSRFTASKPKEFDFENWVYVCSSLARGDDSCYTGKTPQDLVSRIAVERPSRDRMLPDRSSFIRDTPLGGVYMVTINGVKTEYRPISQADANRVFNEIEGHNYKQLISNRELVTS